MVAADDLKTQGNALYQEGNYRAALQKYEEGLELSPQHEILRSNAANTHLKLYEYEEALYDASEAVSISPLKIKPRFFKALALTALRRYDDALQELRHGLQLEPSNPLILAKKTEVEILRRTELFHDAIHVPPVLLTQAYIDAMDLPTQYDGPPLPSGAVDSSITLTFIKEMLSFLKAKKKFPLKYTLQILLWAKNLFSKQASLIDVTFPKEASLTLCGDIHGQFLDLLNIFERFGHPSETHLYLFNGDFVDRGPASIECVLTLLAYKLMYPSGFFMARGNHESSQINKLYGFEADIKRVYGEDDNTFLFFQQVFNTLPLAHVIQSQIFVTHGGLPGGANISLDDIRKIDRFHDPSTDTGLMHDLCWADPRAELGVGPSHRGTSITFGPDITKAFLDFNRLELLVRSHEFQENGYKVDHDGLCVTIFSAPNYVNGKNKGAVIQVAYDGSYRFETFEAV